MQERLGTKGGIKKVQRSRAETQVSGVNHTVARSLRTDVSKVKRVAVFHPLHRYASATLLLLRRSNVKKHSRPVSRSGVELLGGRMGNG